MADRAKADGLIVLIVEFAGGKWRPAANSVMWTCKGCCFSTELNPAICNAPDTNNYRPCTRNGRYPVQPADDAARVVLIAAKLTT
jgi:hypothetical protein